MRSPHVLTFAVGALAMAVASAGTAVAVTAQTVQLADPTTPSHVAHVDASGRLSTSIDNSPAVRIAPPNQGFNLWSNFGDNAQDVRILVGPTAATLAITRLSLMNDGGNAAYPHTTMHVDLLRITPDPGTGSCTAGSTSSTAVSTDRLAPGDEVTDTYSTPLVVKPAGTTKYCIALQLWGEGGTLSTYIEPTAQLTGYLVAGSFTSPQPLAVTSAARLHLGGRS